MQFFIEPSNYKGKYQTDPAFPDIMKLGTSNKNNPALRPLFIYGDP